MQEQEEIKIYPKVAKILFGSLAFVLLGIGLIYAGITSGNILIVIVGFMITGLFAIGLVFSVTKLFQSEPALLINREGIVDKSSLVSAGAVAWSEIKDISLYQIKNEKMIGIELYDPEQWISRQPFWKQKLMNLNRSMTGATIHISSSGMSCNLYELFPVLYRRWNMFKSSSDREIQERGIR